MSSLLSRSVRTLLLANLIVLGTLIMVTDRAAATTVQVDGTFYNVVEYARDVEFKDVRTALEGNTALLPWWGSETKARAFATAFAATLTAPITRIYAFVYDVRGPTPQAQSRFVYFDASAIGPAGPTFTSGDLNINSDATGYSWMAVPEIDGPVLARMSLIFSVLCIGLMALRGRATGVSPRA